MEELSRATINEWWEAHEKPDDYVLTRGEYKELAEFVVPEAKPVEDETMDELVAQCDNGLVRKEEAMRVLSKARSYLRTHRELEALYDRVVERQDGVPAVKVADANLADERYCAIRKQVQP